MTEGTTLVVNDYDGLYTPFWRQLGGKITNDISILLKAVRLGRPQDVRLVCFTGGADVSPELYGHKNLGSYTNISRDRVEQELFNLAIKQHIPMTGICRGAQFLNVMCGGTLVQDFPGHRASRHMVETLVSPEGEPNEHLCSGDHHQMIVPGPLGIVMAWATDPMDTDACTYGAELRDSKVLFADDAQHQIFVTEAIAYPNERIFAVQHHPEWQSQDEPCAQWTLAMTRQICLPHEV